MPVELLVILGAEASILGFVAAMSLHAKRMDVLSGRSFEHPIVPLRENRHLGAGRNNADAQRKGASPEDMQSSAAAILHQLSAP
ncbi:hypothetical protein CVM73_38330 [Bradyrhizobium forestalis]|uniref:Uncharacterized protein n=1 Tax=Bradyrhizobium forestalis TaxID=1419263 RepID=A0A2M8QWY0_9BRAD|nr:hypothetical protein CVM73_38330 [Bradyrhizobium forestalis]